MIWLDIFEPLDGGRWGRVSGATAVSCWMQPIDGRLCRLPHRRLNGRRFRRLRCGWRVSMSFIPSLADSEGVVRHFVAFIHRFSFLFSLFFFFFFLLLLLKWAKIVRNDGKNNKRKRQQKKKGRKSCICVYKYINEEIGGEDGESNHFVKSQNGKKCEKFRWTRLTIHELFPPFF